MDCNHVMLTNTIHYSRIISHTKLTLKNAPHFFSVNYLYFLTTAVTTPAILSSLFGLIVLYFGFAGTSAVISPRLRRYFMVHSPSTSAITISPLFGTCDLSHIAISPGS